MLLLFPACVDHSRPEGAGSVFAALPGSLTPGGTPDRPAGLVPRSDCYCFPSKLDNFLGSSVNIWAILKLTGFILDING